MSAASERSTVSIDGATITAIWKAAFQKELIVWQDKLSKNSLTADEFWDICLDFKTQLNANGVEMRDFNLICFVGRKLLGEE